MTTPEESEPPNSPYALLGGAEGLRRLVHRFYVLMEELPEAAACRAIHPLSLEQSEQRLFEYLSFWFGGPPLFLQTRGAPMLRARHLHAPIAGPEIEGWMLCFQRAWAEQVRDAALTEAVMPKVAAMAQHMRNRDDAA